MGIKSKECFYVVKDPRSFTVVGNKSFIIPTNIADTIVELKCNDVPIALFDTFFVDKKPYKVNDISLEVVDYKPNYILSVAKLTKSSLFLLPMLGGNRKLFMYDKLFVNAFIAAEEHKDCIALLYRFSGDTIFLKFEQALKKFRNFRDTFDPSPYFVMFVFDIPTDYKADYQLFIKGKYSEFSPVYKTRILDFHNFNIHGQMAQILFKDEKRRLRLQEELNTEIDPDSELLSIIDVEQETFNPKIYI